MSRMFMNTRSWFLTVLVIVGIAACMVPAAAAAIENARFEIESNPSGAYACIDNWNCQNTPVTFALEPNSYHSLTVSKDGYQMSTQTIYATTPGITSPIIVSLIPNPLHFGSLDISSTPTGAGIWIDRVYYGKTPRVIDRLVAGDHDLLLKKAGYYILDRGITITAGQTAMVNLQPAAYSAQSGYGSLQVDSNPGGAAIYLSNNYQGTTGENGESFDINQLIPGTYTVKLTLPNYQDYIVTPEVKDGIVYTIHAVMAPATPTASPTALAPPETTQSPVGLISIISAIGICSTAVILFGMNRKNE